MAAAAHRRDTRSMKGLRGQPAAQPGTANPGLGAGARDEWVRALLHAHGLRCTTPRLAVLAVLADAESVAGHLTVAQIHRRLVGQGREVDLATVYRTVSTFVALGALHALSIDEHTTTYGLADVPHHHAVCTECATLIEVPAEQLSTALAQASLGSRFTLSESAGLTLHGLCPECRCDESGA